MRRTCAAQSASTGDLEPPQFRGTDQRRVTGGYGGKATVRCLSTHAETHGGGAQGEGSRISLNGSLAALGRKAALAASLNQAI